MLLRSMDDSHDSFKNAMLKNPKVSREKLQAKFPNNYTNSLSMLQLDTAMEQPEPPDENHPNRIRITADELLDDVDKKRIKQKKLSCIGVKAKVQSNPPKTKS